MRLMPLHKLAEDIPEDYVPEGRVPGMTPQIGSSWISSTRRRSPYNCRSASSRKASGTERRASGATEA